MAAIEFDVRVTVRWWLRIYLWLLMWLCVVFDTEPNDEKLSFWVSKGIKTEFVPRKPEARD